MTADGRLPNASWDHTLKLPSIILLISLPTTFTVPTYTTCSILFYSIPICAVLFSSVLLYTQPAGAHHKLGFT